jgi:hypothetical protein
MTPAAAISAGCYTKGFDLASIADWLTDQYMTRHPRSLIPPRITFLLWAADLLKEISAEAEAEA